MAKQYHPDTCEANGCSEEKFIEIKEAYEMLTDKTSNASNGNNFNGANHQGSNNHYRYQQPHQRHFNHYHHNQRQQQQQFIIDGFQFTVVLTIIIAYVLLTIFGNDETGEESTENDENNSSEQHASGDCVKSELSVRMTTCAPSWYALTPQILNLKGKHKIIIKLDPNKSNRQFLKKIEQ